MDYKSKLAMQKAKSTIERHYQLVGTLEHLDTTLRLMELEYPKKIFEGLYNFAQKHRGWLMS